MKKSITLIELIIAMTLMSVVILGTMSFDQASRQFLQSSERKTVVLNEMTYILEHIHKNTLPVTGSLPGGDGFGEQNCLGRSMRVQAQPERWVYYSLSGAAGNELYYCSDWNGATDTCNVAGEILTQRLVNAFCPFPNIHDPVNVLDCKFTLRYDPALPVDPSTNPEVSSGDIAFAPVGISTN